LKTDLELYEDCKYICSECPFNRTCKAYLAFKRSEEEAEKQELARKLKAKEVKPYYVKLILILSFR